MLVVFCVFAQTEDTTKPTLKNLPVGGDLGCNPTLPVCSTTVVAASDNCDAYLSVTCDPGAISNVGTCGKSQTFTYEATDSCGNKQTATVINTWVCHCVDEMSCCR